MNIFEKYPYIVIEGPIGSGKSLYKKYIGLYYQQIKNKLTDEGNIKEFYDTEANVKNLEMLLKSVSMN